jgi:hypothetical protein
MITAQEFNQAIANSIVNYPALAPLFEAKDPRILQPLEAISGMLSMLSAQLDVAASEPFDKVRDATVLADAAMRGIIRKSKPAQVNLTVTNSATQAVSLQSGRVLFDSDGNEWRTMQLITIPAQCSAVIGVMQFSQVVISHAVSGANPFYAIAIPAPNSDNTISSVSVSDALGFFEYRARYVNTLINERVFNIESDDYEQLYVQFGIKNVAGYQPTEGDVIILTVNSSVGELTPILSSKFTLAALQSPSDAMIDLTLLSVVFRGESPVSMETLRQLAKYPAIYDDSAVFLNEFDFVIRKNNPSLAFLSVWNEVTQEAIRGASVNNINTLFVSFNSGTEPFLTGETTQPSVILTANIGSVGNAILSTIKKSDDSYKVVFYTPVKVKIPITITGTIASSYRSEDVSAQIKAVLIANYGETSQLAKQGGSVFDLRHQAVYTLLKNNIPALSGGGSDFTATIGEQATNPDPVLWRYVAPDSIVISLSVSSVVAPMWN